MELQLIRPHSTVTLALLSAQIKVLLIPKKFWLKKSEDQYFFLNVILTLINYQSRLLINYSTLNLFPISYTGLKSGELIKMGKRPTRKAAYTILQIFSNVVARNETGGRLKLNILLRIIKFWIHLESLPENSIAKQCLIISNQLANETKTSFRLTVNELYIIISRHSKSVV